jgi:hypothetical protein
MEDSVGETVGHDEALCRFVADEYVSKVLSATYGRALSIQQISETCRIPIAVAYRRVRRMASIGLLHCAKEESGVSGRTTRYYICAVDLVRYTFERGAFYCQMRPLTPSIGDGQGK